MAAQWFAEKGAFSVAAGTAAQRTLTAMQLALHSAVAIATPYLVFPAVVAVAILGAFAALVVGWKFCFHGMY